MCMWMNSSVTLWTHLQDELYEHLDELQVLKVDKQVNEAMVWMNSKMNQQSKQDLTLEPAVKVHEIYAKVKVRNVRDITWKRCV